MAPATRKNPKIIGGDGFTGSSSLTLQQLIPLEIRSVDDTVENILRKTNWDGGVVGFVAINLSNDNLKVTAASFNLTGKLFPEYKSFPTSRVFKLEDSLITLSIKIQDASIFSFKDGLTSELVDSNLIDHHFSRNGEELTEEEMLDLDLDGFCLRLYCSPSRQDWIRFNLTIIPMPLTQVEGLSTLVNNPLFPSMSLITGDLPLKPVTEVILPTVLWGFPILPAIIPGMPLAGNNNCPTSGDIRAAVSALLRRVVKPEIKQNVDYWITRCDEIVKSGEPSLKELAPEMFWPLPVPLVARVIGRGKIANLTLTPPPSLYFLVKFQPYS